MEESFSRELTREAAALTDYTIDPIYNFDSVVEYRSGMKTTKPYTKNARNQLIQAGQEVPGSWSLDPEKRQATFDGTLTDTASYQLVIGSNVRDLALNPMDADYQTTFTGASSLIADTKAPEVETIWQKDGNVYVRFTEDIDPATVTNDAIQIDFTPAGRTLNELDLYSRLGGRRATVIWARESKRYANSASGRINLFIWGSKPNRVIDSLRSPFL